MGWGVSIEKCFKRSNKGVEKRGNVERDVPGQEEERAMFQGGFSPQKHESLLVLLTSFLGKAVFDLLRLMEVELLGVLEAKFSPFVRPSSPCSSGHS